VATGDDKASISRFNDYLARVSGFRTPDAELRAVMVVDETGRVLGDVTATDIPQAIRRGVERPDYTHVQAPALALYQPNDARFVFPNFQQFGEADNARAKGVIQALEPMMLRGIEQFRREVVHGRAIRLTTGSHYFFITNEDEVVRLMREFLAAVPPS
jgi:hypothetical protein